MRKKYGHETARRAAVGRPGRLTVVALVVVATALGASLAAREVAAGSALAANRAATTSTQATTTRTQATTAPSLAARRQMPIPVRVVIPAIGVNARVVPLGLNSDRTMQVPTTLADTGWFRPGPEPGEQGAAVIVGHLNSTRGPGVFARLSTLKVGDVIRVQLQGGSTVRFVAKSMMRVAKSRFPTSLVYAKTAKPTLRLITCAGRLNRATGHHYDNYIVFASLVSAAV